MIWYPPLEDWTHGLVPIEAAIDDRARQCRAGVGVGVGDVLPQSRRGTR
jgi:hypothetical protein